MIGSWSFCIILLNAVFPTIVAFQTSPSPVLSYIQRTRSLSRDIVVQNESLSQGTTTSISYVEAKGIRTEQGHNAAKHHYQQLLQSNQNDTSAATRIAAANNAMNLLAKVGCPYSYLSNNEGGTTQLNPDWEEDIAKLRSVLELSNYNHSSLRKHIFNLPTRIYEDGNDLEKYKNDYPMGPTYVTPLVAGQGLDVTKLINTATLDGTNSWLPSLQCLATLFLLSSCVPKHVVVDSLNGGYEALDLLLKLGIVAEEEELVVPLVHLFPIQMRSLSSSGSEKHLVLMTDLHPTVLGLTSIPYKDELSTEEKEEGAVMYIGPDSLALVHHLHASIPQCIEKRSKMQPLRVLDVCTGSGVQALSTLAMLDTDEGMDHTIVAVDVNKRALRFTAFNAILNGYQDRISTVHADLLSGNNGVLANVLLSKLEQQSFHYDLLLANPPFIPTPPSRSDNAASALRLEECNHDIGSNTPRYGLFSSGGATGEDCLIAIVQIAPLLLRSDGGLLAIVSEFMNPGTELTSKIERWWVSENSPNEASGILFTNEFPIDASKYAQRRSTKNDEDDVSVWEKHLNMFDIKTVSPGLLFIQTVLSKDKEEVILRHAVVPKSKLGSIWTPHNYCAIEYTSKILTDLYKK